MGEHTDRTINSPGNSSRELILFISHGVFIPLGRCLGSLGQDLCGYITPVRARFLEDTSFAYSSVAVGLSWGQEL